MILGLSLKIGMQIRSQFPKLELLIQKKIPDIFLNIPPVTPIINKTSENAEILVTLDLDPGHLFKRCIVYIKPNKSDFFKTNSFESQRRNCYWDRYSKLLYRSEVNYQSSNC